MERDGAREREREREGEREREEKRREEKRRDGWSEICTDIVDRRLSTYGNNEDTPA